MEIIHTHHQKKSGTGIGFPRDIHSSAHGSEHPGSLKITPEYIRLPKSPGKCPLTGLSRSALNELILPSQANGFKAPVKSLVLKKRHAVRGVRLIVVSSLLEYLDGLTPRNAQTP